MLPEVLLVVCLFYIFLPNTLLVIIGVRPWMSREVNAVWFYLLHLFDSTYRN